MVAGTSASKLARRINEGGRNSPKSKIQFNGVGGLRTYISFTHSAFSDENSSVILTPPVLPAGALSAEAINSPLWLSRAQTRRSPVSLWSCHYRRTSPQHPVSPKAGIVRISSMNDALERDG
jgi:hypothetical protein